MQNSDLYSEREKIAARIRDARVLAGLSQAQAAEKLNLQRPAISEIESGRRKVSAEEVIQFAELYKVDTSWILLQNEQNEMSEQITFAARELSKLKPDQMSKVIDIIKMLPKK
ncbi:helix-turn-helix domain-containing protein [Dyadobacter sp. OTU695]|uniref:helix-turn-helix domain-containing protein n=1 Tax=Dyadobacter sp. OTU695 TaxID=3043860 RepID=UPI00313C016F